MPVHPPKPGATTLYRAFGLRIESELVLPELGRATAGAADLRIVCGKVGAADDDARSLDRALRVSPHAVWLETAAGRYCARGGRCITVDQAPDAPARDVRLYLLGTMIGAVLHQRGVLPLHANAVCVGDHAIALAGSSGAGKSTLAAFFQHQGHSLLSDDVSAVTFDEDGRGVIWPGLARIKLRADTLAALGRSCADLDVVATGVDKFSLPVRRPPVTPRPLRRLYVLDARDTDVICATRLNGPEAVDAVLANTYRWPVAVAMICDALQFANAVKLVRGCEIVLLRYPRGFGVLPDIVHRLAKGDPDALPGPRVSL